VSDYGVLLLPSAQRALRRLPEKVATAVLEFMYGSLATNPYRVGKELKFDYAGLHSARRGEYRVLYRIDEDQHRVVIITVEHRADAYRPNAR
jgi:mRNA-degrading endonuclease RelE of RelBE toxin-antitoxin system